MPTVNTALVLAGGGGLGGVQVGMLQALIEVGVTFDVVLGALGSINGAYHHPQPAHRYLRTLSSDNAEKALLASAAIPVVFSTVRISEFFDRQRR